jgi:predicted enzyme related to lactoylglutathione lyase
MPQLYRVIIPVSDMEKAQEFYESILGIDGERVSPERHYFDCEGTILACFDPTMSDGKSAVTPNPEHIYISVDDLSSTYQRCKTVGAEITIEIDSYPWGETSFYIRDPFGNPLCFVERSTVFRG